MTRTFATLFQGGDLAGVGLQAAGLEHLWGVELEPDIAAVAEMNGFSSIVVDVREVDFTALAAPYWLHMSPPCINASVAKTDGGETDLDGELAAACVRAIEALRPGVVSLKNVWGYRTFAAFKSILRALSENGYKADFWHLNSADYGVPQTRQRLILLARRDGVYPRKPGPTHAEVDDSPQLSLFASSTPPWVGWYEAIEDLIPTLPDSEFAPWQLERLPAELTTMLVEGDGAGREYGEIYKPVHAPSPTVNGSSDRHRAFLVEGTAAGVDNKFDLPVRKDDEPSMTIRGATHKGMPRAFLLSNNAQEYADGVREGEEPAHSITQQSGGRYRALLVPGGNANSFSVRLSHEPARVIGDTERVGNLPRALLMTEDSKSVTGDALAPAQTVVSSSRETNRRAWLQHGRVVKMTPRALARFQSVPDWYVLPEKASLACKVIGNGVPCLLMQRIAESVVKDD